MFSVWYRYTYYLIYSSPILCKASVTVPCLQRRKLGQWDLPDEPPFLASVMSGLCIPRSLGDQHGTAFPDGSDGHPGLGITTLKCPHFLSADTTRAEMPLLRDQMMLRYVSKLLRAFPIQRRDMLT